MVIPQSLAQIAPPDGWLADVTAAGGGGQVEAHRDRSLGGPRCSRRQARRRLDALFPAPRGCDCSTAQTRGSGARGECRGRGAGRRGFHRPPAIHAGERKWTGGFCGPVTVGTLGQTPSTSFRSHLHPHLLPAGRRQAPACRKPSETGGPGGGPGKAPPGGETRLHLGKREGQVLSQLALVRTSM